MSACAICLEEAGSQDAHPACVRGLFSSTNLPSLDIDLAHIHTLGLAMAGRASISGVQRKVSLGLSVDRQTLQVATSGARYILKPQAGTFPALPENEHVTMKIAAAFGLEVPACGLIRLRDGSLAYIVERFDRPRGGGKRRQEDFCQLAELSPKQKYDGSAELCVRLVRRYATEPGVATLSLFRQLVFGWWTGNGDMHLKNLSLLTGEDGHHRLSPAYDLLCTRLVIANDPLALPVSARKDRLDRATWLRFAAYARIPAAAAERVLARPSETLPHACELVARSFLPEGQQLAYLELLTERAARLTALARPSPGTCRA